VFRNVFCRFQEAAIKLRNGPRGFVGYYHNTCRFGVDFHGLGEGDSEQGCFGADAECAGSMKTRNNIFVGNARAYFIRGDYAPKLLATLDYDFNVIASPGTKLVRPVGPNGEKNSIKVMPEFLDFDKGDLRLANDKQPSIDAGEVIKGINDDVPEAYQYKGKAPDIGAYEWGAAVPQYGVRPLK
jgi:hypothetical protein